MPPPPGSYYIRDKSNQVGASGGKFNTQGGREMASEPLHEGVLKMRYTSIN
jgi:hypothetical protein